MRNKIIKIHIEPRYVKKEDWNGQRIRPFQKEASEDYFKGGGEMVYEKNNSIEKFK